MYRPGWRAANREQPVPEAGQMSCQYHSIGAHGQRCDAVQQSFASLAAGPACDEVPLASRKVTRSTHTRWLRQCPVGNSCPLRRTASIRHAKRMRAARRRDEELQAALVHTFALCLVRLVAGPVNCAVQRSASSRSYGHWQSSSVQTQRQPAHDVPRKPGRVVWVVRGFCLSLHQGT